MHRGSVVCHGSSTGLKGQYGDGYSVTCTDRGSPDNNEPTWKLNASAEATRKVLELEAAGMTCDVTYPTLEQAFLKVTNNMHGIGDDGAMLDKEGNLAAIGDANKELEASGEHSGNDSADLNLEVARSIGTLRQTWVLLRKRFILLQSNWFSYLVNLAIPIVVAAALFKFIKKWETLQTCDMHREALYAAPPLRDADDFGSSMLGALDGTQIAAVGPQDSFSSDAQNQLLIDSM